MGDIKLEPKESLVSILSWGAYVSAFVIARNVDTAETAKSAVESLGGMVSLQEKDSISQKVSDLCKKSWDIVLKQYNATSLKTELRNYNFASDPFHWDNTLTIQARIIDACKKKKISIVKIPYKKISESVVTQLAKKMDDDPSLKTLFLLKKMSNDNSAPSTEGNPIPREIPKLTDIPSPTKLYGRENAISDIYKKFETSDIICILADGGVGKTAVALTIMEEVRKSKNLAGSSIEYFAWITSSGNLKKDLTQLKVSAAMNVKTDAEKLENIKDFLQLNPTFLVIDNMDDLLGSDGLSLLNTISGKTKVLITSRIRQEGISGYKLKELEPDTAMVFFYNCYFGNNDYSLEELKAREDVEFVQKITKSATYNALFIELIGKMARWEYRNRLDSLWKTLENNIFNASSKSDIKDEHSYSHGLSESDLKLQNQIIRLYALSDLPEKYQEIMNFMAQFPAETSIFDDLLEWAGFDINDLKWLTERAWIEQGEDGYLLHTMVRGSVWKQDIEFDIWKYENLINKLGNTDKYMPVTDGYLTIRKRLGPVKVVCDLIGESIGKKLEDSKGNIAVLTDAGYLFNNLAGVYQDQGNYEEALKYFQKDLEISEKVLGKKHPDTAATYNNLAGVYQAQGNYEEALKYFQKALTISEKVLGKNHPNTASTYNNLGILFYYMNRYEESMKYLRTALSIWKKKLGPDHPYSRAAIKSLEYVEKVINKQQS